MPIRITRSHFAKLEVGKYLYTAIRNKDAKEIEFRRSQDEQKFLCINNCRESKPENKKIRVRREALWKFCNELWKLITLSKIILSDMERRVSYHFSLKTEQREFILVYFDETLFTSSPKVRESGLVLKIENDKNFKYVAS